MKLIIFLIVLCSSLLSGCTSMRGFGGYEIHEDLTNSVAIVPSQREFSITSIDREGFLFGNGARTAKPGAHIVGITCGKPSCDYTLRCDTQAGHVYTVSSSGCKDAGVLAEYNNNEAQKDAINERPAFARLGSPAERERSPFKQCYAGKVNETSDLANPYRGKVKWNMDEPLATELPQHKSAYTNEQRLKAFEWSVKKGCSASTDLQGGYARGRVEGRKAYLYCTDARGVTEPHLSFDLEILPNGLMVRHRDTCVTVMDDESITAQFVAESAPNKLD